MEKIGVFGSNNDLASSIGINKSGNQFWNLTASELIEDTIITGEGVLSDTGALAIETGEFTGRSPKDRFIVKDSITEKHVWWGDINIPFTSEKFDSLYDKMKSKNNWNLERYIKFYLKQKGYSKKIRFFPYIMYSVRNNKIKTTFRPGRYSYKHKYYIKYFKEYLSSIIIYYLLGNKNKNYSNFTLLNIMYKIFKNLFKIKLFLYLFLCQKDLTKKFDKEFLVHNLKKKFII